MTVPDSASVGVVSFRGEAQLVQPPNSAVYGACFVLWVDAMEPALWQQIFTVCLVVAVFVCFVKEWFSPDLVAMAAFVSLILTGILTRETAGPVFGSSAPIVVASMFILSAALERTGVIEALGHLFERIAGTGEVRILLLLTGVVGLLSGFVNNTPVVVVFMPIVLGLCRRRELMASRFLIPLSYAAIAGGTISIIGTSTNLVAAAIAEQASERPFGMFEITKLGVVFLAVTTLYMVTVGRRLLPDRVTLSTLFESEEGREFLTQAFISEDSSLVGKVFKETPLAKLRTVRVIEVIRRGTPIRLPLPQIRFEAGDQLLLKTRVEGVLDVNQTQGLKLGVGSELSSELGLSQIRTESAVLMEGILGPNSDLIGKSLKQLHFRQRFGVLILAVHRKGENLRERFEDVELAFGDTLLVEGPVEKMNALFAQNDFVNLSRPKQKGYRRSKSPYAIGALVLFLILGSLTHLPLMGLALASALIVLFTRCLEPREAYRAVDWRVIFLIFGMLGLGRGLQQTQVVDIVAVWLVGALQDLGPYAVLAMVYLLAAVLTEIISNNAVAALLTPIAIGVAVALDVDARPFVVAVMFGSSASFATPIGYQTNTYVYGAGGYRFGDFGRVGLPLALILWLIASVLIPLYWPLKS